MSNRFLQSIMNGLWPRRSPQGQKSDLDSVDPERRGQGLFRRGRTRMRVGEMKEALAEFDQALAVLPDYAEAVAARAESLDLLGSSKAARTEYERARRLWAAQRRGAPDRRYLFRRPGRFTFEMDSYELALRRIKTGSFPHLACGNALLVQGDAEEALKCYDRALKIKPNNPDLTALRGEALSMLARYEQAIEAFDFALGVNPRDGETLNARAIANMALGRIEQANADWRRQRALLPAAQGAARTCIALRMADYATALPELERLIVAEPCAYWRLYRLTAQRRLGIPSDDIKGTSSEAWPMPLLAVHAGTLGTAAAEAMADTADRRAEVAFQLGVLAVATDRELAARHWAEVLQRGTPALIEYAAARNELARLGQPA